MRVGLGCLEGESGNEGSSTQEGGNTTHVGLWSSTGADDTVREGTGSLDGTGEEAGTARALDGVVEVRLTAEQGGVGDSRCVGEVSLERDVGGEDGTGARGAELGLLGAGFEEEESEVGGFECAGVELEDGLGSRGGFAVKRSEGSGTGSL